MSEDGFFQGSGIFSGPTLGSGACWISVFEFVGGDDAAQASMVARKSGGGQHWTKDNVVDGLRRRIEVSTEGGNILSKHSNDHIAPKLAYDCLDNNLMQRLSDGIYSCTFVNSESEQPTSANISSATMAVSRS